MTNPNTPTTDLAARFEAKREDCEKRAREVWNAELALAWKNQAFAFEEARDMARAGAAGGAGDLAELAAIRAMLLAGQGDDGGMQILPDLTEDMSLLAMVASCVHLLEKRRDIVECAGAAGGAGGFVDSGRAALAVAIEDLEATAAKVRAGASGDKVSAWIEMSVRDVRAALAAAPPPPAQQGSAVESGLLSDLEDAAAVLRSNDAPACADAVDQVLNIIANSGPAQQGSSSQLGQGESTGGDPWMTLWKIAALRHAEDAAEPFNDALDLADAALAFGSAPTEKRVDLAVIRDAVAAGRFRITTKELSDANSNAGMVWPIEIELPCINGLSCWFTIGNIYTPDAAARGYTDGVLNEELARDFATHIISSLTGYSFPLSQGETVLKTASPWGEGVYDFASSVAAKVAALTWAWADTEDAMGDRYAEVQWIVDAELRSLVDDMTTVKVPPAPLATARDVLVASITVREDDSTCCRLSFGRGVKFDRGRAAVETAIAALRAELVEGQRCPASLATARDGGTGAGLDDRMRAAGMFTVPEMMGETPLSRWEVQSGMTDLTFFAEWLDRRTAEYLRMKAAYELGEKYKTDELYEWVLAHSAAFASIRTNFRAASASARSETPAHPQSPQGGEVKAPTPDPRKEALAVLDPFDDPPRWANFYRTMERMEKSDRNKAVWAGHAAAIEAALATQRATDQDGKARGDA